MSVDTKFSLWLNEKLKTLKLDESIFGTYIVGILDCDETDEEKSEALDGILCELVDVDLDELKKSILSKWQEYNENDTNVKTNDFAVDMNEKLVKLLEATKIQTNHKEREYTEEERLIREHILSQYSQTAVTDDEDDGGEEDPTDKGTAGTSAGGMSGGGGGGGAALERNTNVQDVMQLQRERREQARQDSAAKKQKDKEDREKQKQMREEKKEKRKTVKGERKR